MIFCSEKSLLGWVDKTLSKVGCLCGEKQNWSIADKMEKAMSCRVRTGAAIRFKAVQEWGGKVINHSDVHRVGLCVGSLSLWAIRGTCCMLIKASETLTSVNKLRLWWSREGKGGALAKPACTNSLHKGKEKKKERDCKNVFSIKKCMIPEASVSPLLLSPLHFFSICQSCPQKVSRLGNKW